MRHYEQELRAIKEIRIERIIKNHAQLMALVEALRLVALRSAALRCAARAALAAVARQHAVNSDPKEVAELGGSTTWNPSAKSPPSTT